MKKLLILVSLLALLTNCSTSPKKSPYLSNQQIEQKYSTGNKVVMVTHPYCGFSRRAFQDFDEETRNYISTNGVLIAPVNKKYEEEQLGGVLEWNKKHSQSQHIPVDGENKLKDLDLNSTPQFYFFKKGKLISKVIGWPKDKSNAKLVRENINLLKRLKK